MAKELAKSRPKHQQQFRPIDLSLAQISGMHPILDKLAAISSNLEYLLGTVREINPDYFLQLMQLHPLAVIDDDGKYYCVSNPRLFQIAKIVLPDNQVLNCKLIQDLGSDAIADFGQTDFYLCHLLFSLRPQDGDEQLCRFWNALDADLRIAIMPGIKHLNLLAKLLKAPRNQTYLRRKKTVKKNNDSGD